MDFRDRIIDLRRVPAKSLRHNPKNWRTHSEYQKSAVSAALERIGFIGPLIVREKDGELELIDGHLRSDVSDGEVPVVVVDLNDEEMKIALATYDPLTELAGKDEDLLAELITDIDSFEDMENADLRKLLSDLMGKMAKKDEEEQENEHDVPGMALQPHEHYDYLVVLASTAHDWNVLLGKLKLEPQKRRNRMGTARGIRAEVLLEYIRDLERKAGIEEVITPASAPKDGDIIVREKKAKAAKTTGSAKPELKGEEAA